MVNNFRGRQPEHEHSHMDNLAQMPTINIPRVESPLEKVMSDLKKKKQQGNKKTQKTTIKKFPKQVDSWKGDPKIS